MPPRPRPLTRRTTLALAGLGLAALTGCDDRDEPSSGPSPTPSADPDQALVDQVVEQLSSAWQQVRKTGPAGFKSVHEAHLEALGATTPKPVDWRMPRQPVRQLERQVHDELVAASMAAESGDLARLFASMSAAVAQQLEVL